MVNGVPDNCMSDNFIGTWIDQDIMRPEIIRRDPGTIHWSRRSPDISPIPRPRRKRRTWLHSGHARNQILSVARARDQGSFLTDLPFFLAILAVFALVIGVTHYRGEFSEDDFYGVLVGLLNGQATGRWSDVPGKDGIRSGYGYVALIYWCADMHVFTITRDNSDRGDQGIGFAAAIVSAALCMVTLRIMYGAAVALIATSVLIFSPYLWKWPRRATSFLSRSPSSSQPICF